MQFLDRLTPGERERLRAAARRVELARGAWLIRRGEAAGDLYLVESGAVEVVDTRSRPEVVLDVIGPGSVVGEMSFLDASPRAADVRASADARCLLWERGVLRRVLDEDTALATAFYRALAELIADRLRSLNATAVSGALGRPRGSSTAATGTRLTRQAVELSAEARRRWGAAERAVTSGEPGAVEALDAAAAEGLDTVRAWLSDIEDGARRAEAGQALGHALHPFLVRARGVSLAWEDAGRPGTRRPLVAHLGGGVPAGEGALGMALDRALLATPTAVGLRRRVQRAASAIGALLPEGDATALVVNGAASGLWSLIGPTFGGRGARATAVEGDRGLLQQLDALPGLAALRRVHDDLARLCMGASRQHHEPQRLVVLDALLDALPERITVSLLEWARDRLAPGGALVLTALAPSDDAPLFDDLLAWPTTRRSAEATAGLLEDLGFVQIDVWQAGVGLVLSARSPGAL